MDTVVSFTVGGLLMTLGIAAAVLIVVAAAIVLIGAFRGWGITLPW